MPGLPARCTKCGLVFEGRGIAIEGDVQNLQLANNFESCPRCGSPARIVEGTFNIREGVFEVLRGTYLDRDLLQRFAQVAQQARAGAIPMEEAASQIAKESPTLASLLEHVPTSARTIFIWVLLAALQILAAQTLAESRDQSATRETIEHAVERQDKVIHNDVQQAVERALNEYYNEHPEGSPSAIRPARTVKVPRNAPCPCGSGQKYKKCCGR